MRVTEQTLRILDSFSLTQLQGQLPLYYQVNNCILNTLNGISTYKMEFVIGKKIKQIHIDQSTAMQMVASWIFRVSREHMLLENIEERNWLYFVQEEVLCALN